MYHSIRRNCKSYKTSFAVIQSLKKIAGLKLSKIKLYFHSIRYLKWIQIRYQIWFRLRLKWRYYLKHRYQLTSTSHSASLKFNNWIDKPKTIYGNEFRFFNLPYKFENNGIVWNYNGLGKLWNYNLNYMDFLLQPNMGKERGIKLINDYIKKLDNKSIGLESFPISIRGVNWIKFLSKHGIKNPVIDNSLFAQYKILFDNQEYHLLGNHLLENGFSFLFAGFYFNDSRFFTKAKDIIETELNEQILTDGGHFELSPMYHQIILDRILDCINLLQNNESFKGQVILLAKMKRKAKLMIRWLNSVTFSSGQIPMLNDSAPKIAPSTKGINNYAIRLGLITEALIREVQLHPKMKDSGFRRINGSNYECIMKVGQIGPDYQPGHAHADTFNFELNLYGKPLIVDTGISTYEKNERRQFERGTAAHNTVQINEKDSSEVWDGFRVSRRAHVLHLEETDNKIIAKHDGYEYLGIIHERIFQWDENRLEIIDQVLNKNAKEVVSRFHFYPNKNLVLVDNKVIFEGGSATFVGAISILLNEFQYASEFNKLSPGIVIEVIFINELISNFEFK